MSQGLLSRFHPLHRMEKQRSRALQKGTVPALAKPLFEAALPSPDCLLSELECIVLDFETSGLDCPNDAILSVGMLNLNYPILSLGSAQHYYVKAGHSVVADTAVINHIVPETLMGGMPPEQVAGLLVNALRGKVVIAHGAWIEKQFLHALLGLDDNTSLPLVFLDTLAIERSMMVNTGMVRPDLRLASIRENRNLPPYLAHNAFADAVATGELLLAQVADIFGLKPPVLGPLVRRSAN